MSTYTKAQLNEIVARVTQEVTKEVTTGEARSFGVTDLRAQFPELGEVGKRAWTISYSTASNIGINAGLVQGQPGNVAWTISYNTSSGPSVDKDIGR